MIFRINKDNNYTVMSNYHLKDKNLSLKAKGLLSLILSLPDGWDYSVRGLSGICKETKDTINGIIQELELNKYIERKRIYSNGKISKWEYNVFENNLHPKNQDIEKQDIENYDVYKNTKELITNNNIYIIQFEKFYESYPKKQSKKSTEKWFLKNKPNEKQFEEMMNSLEKFKKCKQWQNSQYIPMPTTWLNQERWLDEVDEDIQDYGKIHLEID